MAIDAALIECFAEISSAAGAEILKRRGEAHRGKADGSPVTAADEAAEALVLERLARLLPGVPVISEEAAAAGVLPGTDNLFLLVDPLDGTREFIAGSNEFTVNIALIEAQVPVAGVIFAPALGRLWLGGDIAETCELAAGGSLTAARGRRTIAVRPARIGSIVAAASLRHNSPETDAFLARCKVTERRGAGSSLKFCLVAEGQADLYPRFAPTMEWDTAAGDAILRAAGGKVVMPDGRCLRYGKRASGYLNPSFIACADPAFFGLDVAGAALT